MDKRTAGKTGARGLAVMAAAALIAAPLTVYGADKPNNNIADVEAPRPDINQDMSPSFAYSDEKWASLRDNVMEYGELAELVHEYNPTVRSNRSTYNDQKNKDLNDVYDELMSDVQDIWDSASDSDNDVMEATLNFSANSLAQQADNNYQDAEMEKIQYDQTEAGLVYQAQQLMSTYEQSKYNLENLQSARSLLEAQYNLAQTQRAVGAATDTDVLNALKSLQDQDAAIVSAQKSQDNVHRTLCLMLGWAADAQPEIRDVPEPDLSRIETMDPQKDLEQAMANNYDVRYYTRKANNVNTESLVEAARASLEDAKNTVSRSLQTQYNAVLTARDSLNTAQAQFDLAAVNLSNAQAQMAVGSITPVELQSMENSYTAAKNGVETAKLQLQMAIEGYDWIVKGLTTSN